MIPIVALMAGVIMAIGIPIARAYARRVESKPGIPPELSGRLERMEQSIEAIAVEVERISEGQRFTTRLLAERAEAGEGQPAALGAGSRARSVPPGERRS